MLTKRHTKLAKRDLAPDMSDLGKADNLLRQMWVGHEYDPLTELINIARNKNTSDVVRMKIATELLSYVAPKRKAAVVKEDAGEVININIAYPNAELPVEKIIDIELEEEVYANRL